ncbi:MAG: hypothetical protein A2Y10_04155 [Planctomycetes bacterium GWF2_41_51]|nr:MAG: hypothetical protein A2Y10_04155 [Planctomycetes bacterium GWF2_41_51]HBG26481.1 efflux transporter periplasmic adaptor subunit [Phycisphaerales bacterium]
MKYFRKHLKLIIIVLAAAAVGFFIRGGCETRQKPEQAGISSQAEEIWTCSMHPQIRQPKPGKCPICGMNLIPVEQQSPGAAQRQITFTNEAMKLMEVETSPVERKFVETQISMVGKIDYDETKVKYITSWVPGRIDRLYVDFTGIQVSKGDHMVYLYSPDLISAQAELLLAAEAKKNLKSGSSEFLVGSTEDTLNATREKLRLLGLSAKQIEEVEKTGKPTDHITINAPIGGIVIEKNINQGAYVETGTKIYTIADLSEVWVKLDAYESDIVWVRYGQEIEFTIEAYPGETFKGTISFISPVLDSQSRTVKLRVNVKNSDRKLKPEMFVHAIVRSKVAIGGDVMDPNMAGKWICPMHPSIIKNVQGECDICGMNLVTTESLGYVSANLPKQVPLVIPASAPLITGKRAVVYVRIPDPNKPTFEGREVVLGPRAGNYYIVENGLSQGEIVVTKGNFKIDSALQIQAKPSMMSPKGEAKPMPGHEGHKM